MIKCKRCNTEPVLDESSNMLHCQCGNWCDVDLAMDVLKNAPRIMYQRFGWVLVEKKVKPKRQHL